MTVRDDILAGKYVPVMPLIDAPVTVGDFSFAQIAKIDVYPIGYDPFAEDKPGQPKIVRIKPTAQFYLELITTGGIVRQRINVKDRNEAEQLLGAEIQRLNEEMLGNLINEHGGIISRPLAIFNHAMGQRLKGLTAVVDVWQTITQLVS